MNYEMYCNIIIENQIGRRLHVIPESLVITKSIKNLADRAQIIMPLYVFNKLLTENFEFIKRGNKIHIILGYTGVSIKTEFKGYIREVKHSESFIIECEDDLFVFRKSISNKQFKPADVKQIARYVCSQIDPEIEVICDYNLPYDKFTVYEATGLDVLMKIQEDTGADVFFLSKENELHIRAAYSVKPSDETVHFSPQYNVENVNLEYIDTPDKKVQIIIKGRGLNGKYREIQYGNMSGDKFEYTMNNMPNESMETRAKIEFERAMKPGYSGSIDTWLVPYVEPGYTIWYEDEDFPHEAGAYLVDSVETKFGRDGGRRTIQLGIKLSI